ncbi:MAG: cation transporter [Bacteroidota bacterium]|nr:cation transporter [Bacteroidota bacterium]
METLAIISSSSKTYLYKFAFSLEILTMLFALAEAIFSIYFGYNDESLSLFGFGVGSFIEVISAIGVVRMIVRIRQNEVSNRSGFEKTALRITGACFYILVAGLVITSGYNIYTGHKPETTLPGVVIALFSIILMYALYYGKTRAGKQLDSDAILADASCTKVCIYMSLVLLVVSGLYEVIKFKYFDSIGTLGIAYLSFKEGKECFEKARSNKHCCC